VSAARQQAAPHQKSHVQATRPRAANDNPRLRRSVLVSPGRDYLFPDQIQERNTGRRNDIDKWLERQDRAAELLRQTSHIADALERAGIRSREVGDQVADFDHVLGTWHQVERFRPIRFLPIIMQRDSAAMLSALRYWMHNHTLGRYVRMATITGGQRVPAFGPLRDRQQAISRAVSKWAHECEAWGVSVVFRSNEHTREQAENGPATYHSHAHVLFTPRLRMEDERWTAFLRWSSAYFRKRLPGALYGFHDCGRIEEPDEACKYTFKPGELAGVSDSELAWLYGETYRTNQKQPLREFKDFRQQLEGNRRDTGATDIARQIDPETGEIIEETRVAVSVRAPLKVVSVWPADGVTGELTPRLEIVHKRRKPKREDRDETRDENGNKHPPRQRENYILFTGNPTATACPYATVRSRVMGFTRNPSTQEGWEGLADLESITRQVMGHWERRGCPPPHRIPLELELHATQLEVSARSALQASVAFRERAGVDCPTTAHDAAQNGLQDALSKAGKARKVADRLRASLGPLPSRDEGAAPYRVHTCSLTVQAEGVDREATGCLDSLETVLRPPDPPPRSHYEVPEIEKSDSEMANTGKRVRPVWACAPMRSENATLNARILRIEADYAAWWEAMHG